jgi:hypothetical protein
MSVRCDRCADGSAKQQVEVRPRNFQAVLRHHQILAGIRQLDFGFEKIIEWRHSHLVIVDGHFRLRLQHGDGFFCDPLEFLGFEEEENKPVWLRIRYPAEPGPRLDGQLSNPIFAS